MQGNSYTIQNDYLSVEVQAKGAELMSLYNKKEQLEYMWSGDPAFWGKHSPVLFPIIGELKNNTYYYNNKAYRLSRHGFARDMEFTVVEQTTSSVGFSLFIYNHPTKSGMVDFWQEAGAFLPKDIFSFDFYETLFF